MSRKDQRKAPVLRFKGFTDDWEQRKLKDEYQKISNAFVGTASPFYVEHGHFYLESNNIKNGQINHDHEVFINDTFYNEQRNKHLHTNDLVMVQSGHVGDSAVITKRYNNIAAHALIMFQNPKYSETSRFLNYYFQSYNAKKKISVISIGNTISRILASDMNKFITSFPKSSEQQKIATIFQRIQDLISLQQQKNADIINLKKAILDKIFSNSNIQKWRDIRLNKVLSIPVDEPKEVTNIDDIISVKLNTQGISKIPNRSTLKLGSTKYYVRHGGQFIFGKQNFFNGSMAIIPSEYDGKVSSKDVPSLNINKDIVMPYFLWLYLSRPSFYKKTERWATGTGSKRLHIKDLLSLKIYIPNKNEQLRICNLMQSLDTQILKSQKHLKELQSIKKFLLQNMFI